MSDKILTEAYAKITAIEEGRYEDEGQDFHDGQQVELKPEYAENPGEVYTLSQWNGRRGWIGDADGRGWGVTGDQIIPAAEDGDDWDTDTGPGENSDAWNDIEEGTEDDSKLHTKAIALLDDMLYMLGEEDQYGEKGDVLRYAIKRLQEVGLGR